MNNEHIVQLTQYLEYSVNEIMVKLEASAKDSTVSQPNDMLEKLLIVALKNEWETALLSSNWAINEADHHFAVLLTRLAGDEAKHYIMIEKLLNKKITLDQKRSPLYLFLLGLEDTFSRVVCGPFTREFLAVRRNRLFLLFCEKYQLSEALSIYTEIQKDEDFHHQLGISLLSEILESESNFLQAKQLIKKMLNIVDDMQEMATLKMGLAYLPGC